MHQLFLIVCLTRTHATAAVGIRAHFTYIYTHTHTHTHARARAHRRAITRTPTISRARARARAHAHTQTHTHGTDVRACTRRAYTRACTRLDARVYTISLSRKRCGEERNSIGSGTAPTDTLLPPGISPASPRHRRSAHPLRAGGSRIRFGEIVRVHVENYRGSSG